jgi:hypothetical protein
MKARPLLAMSTVACVVAIAQTVTDQGRYEVMANQPALRIDSGRRPE